MSLLPDQFHIDRIRSALWHGREFGRAAVMVGAGLSLNARPTSVSAPSFPTWSGLTNRLVDELYPEQSSARSTREHVLVQARSTSGALRLAEEYQAAFGRDALDRLIITAVPDASYEPSPLHSLLLRLPWSDVFTTNYDTLLERAARGLVDRKYDVVRTAAEVPGSARPRIVKLHGSFPSNRPFILTEEDFRTYPDRFAPLVNLTQQAMMENAFCLLGFSGDDPNFLHWSGWVRDNLGRSSPTIYLCGLLDLNSPRRKLLHDRNVIPIDLATLFPPNTPNRHAVALEWFLKTLDEGRWLPLPRKWPYRRENPNARGNAPEGILEVPKPSFPWFTDEELHPQNSQVPLDLKAAVKLLTSWRVTRESYPGWVVAPADNRDRVWMRTDSWLDYLLKNPSLVPLGGQILLLYELNWRIEICLVPLWPDLVVRISEVLRSINPFPGSVELPGAADKLDPESLKLLPMSELPRFWVELAHACLRSSRESQDEENFGFWRSLLGRLAPDHTGLTSRVWFQECLFALGRLDHLAVKKILNGWTTGEEDPFWLIRRAAILVELGELEEASERAEEGLQAIREGIRPEEDDMAMMSREGWAMKLVDAVRRARSGRFFPPDREFTGRWERLAEWGCNPNPELDILKERLKRPMPFVQRYGEIVFSFDLGKASRNHRAGSSLLDQMLPALQTTRLVEDAAYPPNCGSWRLSEDLLAASATWMRDYWPSIATSLILRLSDKKMLEKHFDRNAVAVLPESTVLALHRMLAGSLGHAIGVLSSAEPLAGETVRKVAVDLAEVAVELLSRLAVRLPEELALIELRRAMSLYGSPALAAEHRLTDCLSHLISRSISSLDTEPVSSCVLELLSVPIPGVDGFVVADVQRWPEPASWLGQLSLKVVRGEDPEVWSRVIQWLIRITREVSGEGRVRASWRLTVLWDKGILTSTEVDQFAEAVWAICDPHFGLPTQSILSLQGLLSLPEPEAGISQERVKACCLSSDFVPLSTPITQPDGKIANQFNLGTDTGRFLDEIFGVTRPRGRRGARADIRWVEWNRQDLTRIFDKLSVWWQGEGKGLITGKHRALIYDQVVERQGKILRTIWSILLPRCRRDDKIAVSIRDLILEFDSAGLPVTTAFPPLLRLFPELLDETVRRLRQGLYSRDEELSGQAMGALFIWVTGQVPCGNVPAPPDLLRDFSSLISSRFLPALHGALGHGRRLVELLPPRLHDLMIPNFLVGLDYLLEETRYRGPEELAGSPLRPDQIPEYRLRSSQLAVAISHTSHKDHPVILKWLEAIRTDPLPEIRRVGEEDMDAD